MEYTVECAGWKIEPYKGGIVAQNTITRGPNPPENISMLCQLSTRDNVTILYSTLFRSDVGPEQLASAVDEYVVKAGERDLRKGPLDKSVHIRLSSDHTLFVSYEVTRSEWEQIRNADNLSVELSVPHYLGFVIGITASLEGAQPYMDAATKSCVQG